MTQPISNADQQTWNDLVREYLPGVDNDTAGFVLWNCTCFPFGSEEQVRAQLAECATFPSVEAYADHCWNEMGRILAEAKAEEGSDVA